MDPQCRPSKGDKFSIEYWWIPLEVQFFERDNVCCKGDDYPPSVSPTKCSSRSEAKSSMTRVSTSKLVSAVARIWDCVGQLAVFQTKASLKYDDFFQKENIICYSNNRRKHKSTASADNENVCEASNSESCFLSTAKSNSGDLKTIKKMLLFASCNLNINNSIIWNAPHSHADSSRVNELASIGFSTDLTNAYGSISRGDPIIFTRNECSEKDESCIAGKKIPLANLFATRSTESNVSSEGMDSSGGEIMNLAENMLHPPNSLYPTYSLQRLKSAKEVVESSMKVANSKENEKSIFQELVPEEECSTKHWLSIQDRLQKAFAKNRHALAGALAGSLVTLCLHPLDTVKTVIQVNVMAQKSSYHILKTIASEKGVLGLYRGIGSNVASSAPISAIYTYTYEAVKGVLLPLLPREYQSFGHCIAGGCSSIATSFICTPSECIKQQMQLGSQYQNCWNALIGCLEKGGVPSLYAGWVAVLCRNIPHSIIKFYTYETLKQLLLTSKRSDASLNTLQMLVCGGLAGSTAALFTTPFDVVKTRLQTQAPGSLAKYNGVLHTLQEIARQEGLQGLYRGLTPRLAVYVSQGAIFFASYEFLKAVLPLEAPVVAKEQKADDPAESKSCIHKRSS